MGFNKIFLNEKTLHHHYYVGGALAILKYLSKYDALLSTDELSRKLIAYTLLPKEEFLEKIDELFYAMNK
jgi:hypothetical protein